MNKVYVFISICILMCATYMFGAKIADAKCRIRFTQESLSNTEKQTEQILNNKRILHEQVYKTGVADIRHILQSEYSIAE